MEAERVDITGKALAPGHIVTDGRKDKPGLGRKFLFEVKYVDADVLVSRPLNDFSANGAYKNVTWFRPRDILIVGYIKNEKAFLKGSYIAEAKALGIPLQAGSLSVEIF